VASFGYEPDYAHAFPGDRMKASVFRGVPAIVPDRVRPTSIGSFGPVKPGITSNDGVTGLRAGSIALSECGGSLAGGKASTDDRERFTDGVAGRRGRVNGYHVLNGGAMASSSISIEGGPMNVLAGDSCGSGGLTDGGSARSRLG